ncbi:uncharacterized protein LOC126829506 [Patella vulgata]|uniref:uncharacterized protein LOC126829506 n=1 Tax=Patella vulgata TaxID=6465 RepID=UPI0024A8AC16|nr:uncharacterized protein LOC126829506 [Patella vulgata]
MASDNVLKRINRELEEGCEAKLSTDGRLYYTNHKTQSTSWIPPKENWDPSTGLPYGWETGVDKNDKPYFINHVEKYTTREDPRDEADYIEPPKPREVELVRDPEKGFGFVAGSEKPVVVRFVTDGGPSVDKLLPGDLILKINAEEVRKAPREKVIELVRACKQSIVLTVCQPYSDNSSRKSALLTAAKKAKLKSNPSRVRFAESVMVNGAHVLTPSIQESYVPFMPNVLKVFLENGQTKSFKYDNKTTVKDVVISLHEKLNISCTQHFSLVLQNMKNNTAGKMTLLQEDETLIDIAARPGARHFRCLYRVTFVPRDAYDLLKEDAIAFEYFYLQCCNDITNERFASELKYDTALRLAALQIQQHAMSNNMTGKISIKAIEKECGLDKFVPRSLVDHMKGKDLRKMLNQYLKQNQSLTAPGQKQLTALQAKLHYMKIVSELKTFGSRVFMVTLLDKKTEAMVLVGPKSGVSVVTNIKTYQMGLLAEFDQIQSIKVTKEGENMQRVDIIAKPDKIFGEQCISLGLLTEDAQNFVCMVAGYYSIFVKNDTTIVERTLGKNTSDPDVLAYSSLHRVIPAPWSYPEDLVSEVILPDDKERGEKLDNERLVDLSKPLPEYVENQEFVTKIRLSFKKSEETEPLITNSDQAEVSSVSSSKLNGSLYEESVTSFSANTSHDDSSDNSSLNTSLVSHNSPSFRTIASNSSQPLINGSISNNNKSNLSFTNDATCIENTSLALRCDEAPSDTDSGSGIDIERKPLLPNSGHILSNGDLRNGIDVESDDTDSWGTPQDSPAKPKYGQIPNTLPIDDYHSFGLHSPDVPLGTDINVEDFAASMGLPVLDTITPDVNNIYEPQGVYLDPDIIDLTLIPPPLSSDDESMIDFTMLSSTSSTSKLMGTASSLSLPKKLAKSASVGNCPDFLDNDIDELIARFTVPPPPSESDTDNTTSSNTTSHQWTDTSSHFCDFTKLIIPPPPSVNTLSEENIPIVPPVDEAKQKRKMFRHKRSSSIDIGSLQKAKEILYAKTHSLDSKQSTDEVQRSTDPPVNFGGEFYPVTGSVAESPATVSDKLNKLLHSLPRVGSFHDTFVRTGSLKLSRSSSLDTVAKSGTPPPPFIRTTSLRSVNILQGMQQRSNSLDIKPKTPKHDHLRLIPKAHSFDSVKSQSNDSSSTIASIKAQLQSCRDMLLSRSKKSPKSVTSAKNSDDSSSNVDSTQSDDSGTSESVSRKSSLRRSNSFTQLIDQLSKRKNSKSSNSSSSPVLLSHTSLPLEQDGGTAIADTDKKQPSVLGTLALPKTLRLVANPSSTENKSKGNGPVKAMTSVYATKEKKSDGKVFPPPKKEEHSKKSKKTGSKDDSLMLQSAGKIKWKANPYATIKMWRPITMTTSITSQDDVYQNFTNFENLREVAASLEKPESVMLNTGKIIDKAVKSKTPSEPLTIDIPDSAIILSRNRSVSENSYDVISDTATDTVKDVLAKVYTTQDFNSANNDIDRFLMEIKHTLESLQNSRIDKHYTQFEFCKEELLTQMKQFVNDAKFFVSSANNSPEKLAHYLNEAMHTLAKVFLHSQSVMLMMESVHSAQHLGLEFIKVSHAFKSTISAASAAVGKPLGDPHMKYLMRQAANLASLMSVLLKGLRSLKSSGV